MDVTVPERKTEVLSEEDLLTGPVPAKAPDRKPAHFKSVKPPRREPIFITSDDGVIWSPHTTEKQKKEAFNYMAAVLPPYGYVSSATMARVSNLPHVKGSVRFLYSLLLTIPPYLSS